MFYLCSRILKESSVRPVPSKPFTLAQARGDLLRHPEERRDAPVGALVLHPSVVSSGSRPRRSRSSGGSLQRPSQVAHN